MHVIPQIAVIEDPGQGLARELYISESLLERLADEGGRTWRPSERVEQIRESLPSTPPSTVSPAWSSAQLLLGRCLSA
jgi:hypothetical protein